VAADWDEDSPRLRDNLAALLHALADTAGRRRIIDLDVIRRWHTAIMKGLAVPNRAYVGRGPRALMPQPGRRR
jgi:hypothetical protein